VITASERAHVLQLAAMPSIGAECSVCGGFMASRRCECSDECGTVMHRRCCARVAGKDFHPKHTGAKR
jgi:hypothetical protein